MRTMLILGMMMCQEREKINNLRQIVTCEKVLHVLYSFTLILIDFSYSSSLPKTSPAHPINEKDLLSIESTEYESVVPRTDHIATTPDPVPETQGNSNLEHS